MIRIITFALLTTGMVTTAAAQPAREVAPPPREIRPDGSRDPVPTPVAAEKENPLEVVERIIKNSKDVGDKLAMTDTGTSTQEKQQKILKDIDTLLKQDDPPPDKDKNQDKNDKNDKQDMNDKKDKQPNKDDKKEDMMPEAGMGGMPPMKQEGMPPPKGGMGGMDEQPMGGDQITERPPRKGGGQKQEPKENEPKGGGGNQKQQPMPGMPPKQPPNDPKGGKMPDPMSGMPPPPTQPLLPHEEAVVKDVWGHLPDKLRQQATQYYKMEFTPRYTELLKLYYSSLPEKK